jgi:uncharacterized membrane protein YfcA
VNAFANLISHARAGNVKWPCAATFAASGIAGAFGGAAVGKMTNAHVLLPLFGLAMIIVAAAMLRPRAAGGDPNVHLTAQMAPKVTGAGVLVGFVSGFFGIGGGFLIVPGLMASSGMAMLNAVGSSLFSVGTFGAATAASYAWDGLVEWRIALLFIAGGIVGGLIGTRFAGRLAARRGVLQKVFAGLVFVVAIYVLYRSLGPSL